VLLLVVIIFPSALPGTRGGSCKDDSAVKYGIFDNFGMCDRAFGTESKTTKNGYYVLHYHCGAGWIAAFCALIISIIDVILLIIFAHRARLTLANKNADNLYTDYDYSSVISNDNADSFYSPASSSFVAPGLN